MHLKYISLFPSFTCTNSTVTSRKKCLWLLRKVAGKYTTMHGETDLAGCSSKELLFLLQVLSLSCQGLLLCVLFSPQVAGHRESQHHFTK